MLPVVGTFLPQILGKLTGIGKDILDKALADIRSQVDHEAAKRAAAVFARALYKGIGAAMNPKTGLTVEQRTGVGTALGAEVARQLRQAADQVETYTAAQAAREVARGSADEVALAAREAAEEELEKDLADAAMVAAGRSPHD